MLQAIADDDVPTIVTLMNRAFRGSSSTSWNSEADLISGDRTTVDLMRREMSENSGDFFLKYGDDQGQQDILGFVKMQFLGVDEWHLGSLTIDPDRQSAGLGRKLLSLSEAWIQSRGGKLVHITVVNARHALIEWYIRRGYHLTGETEPWPYGDDRFGTPLQEGLAFVVMRKALTGGKSG